MYSNKNNSGKDKFSTNDNSSNIPYNNKQESQNNLASHPPYIPFLSIMEEHSRQETFTTSNDNFPVSQSTSRTSNVPNLTDMHIHATINITSENTKSGTSKLNHDTSTLTCIDNNPIHLIHQANTVDKCSSKNLHSNKNDSGKDKISTNTNSSITPYNNKQES